MEILNPDNVDEYKEMTGQGIWRFYTLDGNECIMQPWPTLMARTLDGSRGLHAGDRLDSAGTACRRICRPGCTRDSWST